MFLYTHFTKAELVQLEQKYQVPQTKRHFKILSLVYQLQYRFKEEHVLLKKAKKYFPSWQYIQERNDWYATPYLKRTMPRPKAHHPNDDINVPAQNELDQLCIVTGADSNYFEMLVELIESIKATKHYKNVKICVFDCGLTKDQIDYLMGRFCVSSSGLSRGSSLDSLHKTENDRIVIIDPGWDIPVKPGTPNYLKSCLARCFMHKHFPGFKYYLWIDSDAWVQTEWALHNFVNACIKEGYSMCEERKESTFNRLLSFKQYGSIPLKNLLSLAMKKPLNNGVFCIEPYFLDHIGDYLKDYINDGKLRWFFDQNAQNYIFRKYDRTSLNHDENYLHNMGIVVKENDDTLYHPETHEPIGIVHLAENKIARVGNNPDIYLPLVILGLVPRTQMDSLHKAENDTVLPKRARLPFSKMLRKYPSIKYWQDLCRRSVSLRFRVEYVNRKEIEGELSILSSSANAEDPEKRRSGSSGQARG